MRSSRCMFNTATALHRIFIAPIEHANLSLVQRTPQYVQRNHSIPKLLQSQQTRNYASKAEKSRLPRDDEIKSRTICVVAEDGTLSDPRALSLVLSSFDRSIFSLVTVAPATEDSPPVCKIMNKKEMRTAEKARALAARKSVVASKTIELNWAIDGNDLGHRLARIKFFLMKGHKVEVMMSPKRKGRKANEEEAKALVERIRKVIGEVEGAKEWKPMEGKLLGTATVYAGGSRVQVEAEEGGAARQAVKATA